MTNTTKFPNGIAAPTEIITEATTARTLKLSDSNTCIQTTSASATEITIPRLSTVAFKTGTVVEFAQMGAGALTIAAGSGVTLRVPATFTAVLDEQYASAAIRHMGSDVWVLTGQLEAA